MKLKLISPKTLAVTLYILTCLNQRASALDYVSGHISDIYVSVGQNFGYRVNLVGNVPFCSAGGFGYINDTDSNYKVYVANLMMAFYGNKQLTIWTEVINGRCHIVDMQVFN